MIPAFPDCDINSMVLDGIDCRLTAHTDVLFLFHAPIDAFVKEYVQLLICKEMAVRFPGEFFHIFFALSFFLLAFNLDDGIVFIRFLSGIFRVAFSFVEQ